MVCVVAVCCCCCGVVWCFVVVVVCCLLLFVVCCCLLSFVVVCCFVCVRCVVVLSLLFVVVVVVMLLFGCVGRVVCVCVFCFLLSCDVFVLYLVFASCDYYSCVLRRLIQTTKHTHNNIQSVKWLYSSHTTHLVNNDNKLFVYLHRYNTLKVLNMLCVCMCV